MPVPSTRGGVLRTRLPEQSRPAGIVHMAREPERIAFHSQQVLEALAALAERHSSEVVSLSLEEVEGNQAGALAGVLGSG
jgi:hypothetical protein